MLEPMAERLPCVSDVYTAPFACRIAPGGSNASDGFSSDARASDTAG